MAIVPNLIGPENLHAGVAINSLVSNAGRFMGPAIGGYVIYQWGIDAAFALCAFFFGMPALTLLLIRAPRDEIKKSGKRLLSDAIDGMTYSMRHVGIGPVMASLIATAVFGKTIVYLFPAFASDVFHRGADVLAWLTGTVGAGAVLGGIFMARRPGIQGLTRIFVVSMAVVGIGMVVFAVNSEFWVAIAIAAFIGGSLLINGVSAQTLIQHAVDGSMRGRVNSLYVMIQRGGQSFGSLILGVSAELFGLRWSVAAGGVICLAFWVWSIQRSKSMTKTLEA
jgi:predicted MFS family arabinose efflux permease